MTSDVRRVIAMLGFVAGCATSEAPPVPLSPIAALPAVVPVEVAPEPLPEPPAAAPPEDPMLELLRTPPDGWTDLRKSLVDGCFHIGYHRADNFTGAPLPGYGAPGAWLLNDPAAAVARVHADLRAKGLAVIVYDAYRPYRGTQAMVAWAERTDQVDLLDNGYIARRSRHNHGYTIDLGIADAKTCEPIDMGTAWDTLDERSHTRNAEGTVLENRLLLKGLMEKNGFKPYSKEWWHFEYQMPTATHSRDVPYGCQEPEEGAFKPPAHWNAAPWEAPPTPPPGPCLVP